MVISEIAQSCPILWDPMDCSPPASLVHGIFQARILEWVAISFSRRHSWPRDWTQVSCIAGRRFTVWATKEVMLDIISGDCFITGSLFLWFFFKHILPTPHPSLLYLWGWNFFFLDSTYKWDHMVFVFLWLFLWLLSHMARFHSF